jgi:hypothetical protein
MRPDGDLRLSTCVIYDVLNASRRNVSIGPRTIMRGAILVILCTATCLLAQNASAAIKFKRFPHCGDGLVTVKTCECHTATSRHFEYCHAGQYCHTAYGGCRS